jgi:hypothetical protein
MTAGINFLVLEVYLQRTQCLQVTEKQNMSECIKSEKYLNIFLR